jgi:hypothetical protein
VIARELEHVQTRLHAKGDSFFADYDRVHAEGEFRMGVAFPVAVLVMSLGLTGGVAAVGVAVALTTFLLLYVQGFRKLATSSRLLISALETTLVELTEPGLQDPDVIGIRSRQGLTRALPSVELEPTNESPAGPDDGHPRPDTRRQRTGGRIAR